MLSLHVSRVVFAAKTKLSERACSRVINPRTQAWSPCAAGRRQTPRLKRHTGVYPAQVEVEYARNQFDNILRVAELERLFERNGKTLGMDFTTDEDVLRNASGTFPSFLPPSSEAVKG